MALLTVDQWAASVDGKYLDLDGYGVPPNQCHDVWLSYLTKVAGGTMAMGYAPSDYTDSVFTHFPVAGVDSKFTKHNGTAGIRKGDVVFWAYGSTYYPWSHVAVALASPSGNQVYCMTQNPGNTNKANLTLVGALGYLRPKNAVNPPKPTDPATPEEEDDGMFRPTVHLRTVDPEWMRAHPEIGKNLAPGKSRVSGNITVFRGYEVTQNQAVGHAWARTHERGSGSERSADRNGYIAMQKQAERLSVEFFG